MLKKILLVLLLAIVVIQFFRPAKNIAAGEQPNTLSKAYTIPGDVKPILEKACLDCHSNNTRYPWYSKIQPVAWWLAHHVKEGKGNLNVDEYLTYTPKKQDHMMEEVVEMLEKDEMPLKSYRWTHTDARLTEQEKSKLIEWAKSVRKEVSAKTGFIPMPEETK